jgi:hypothetical protein
MNMKYVKKKFKQNFILRKHENMNMKWNEQGYDARLYLKLVFSKVKTMGSYLYLYFCGDSTQEFFYRSLHMHTTQETFLRSFLKYKWITNES